MEGSDRSALLRRAGQHRLHELPACDRAGDAREQIAAHFEEVIGFWTSRAAGKRAYFVVDFDNITINVNELAYYAEQTRRAHELCAISSVRYGGNPLQRTVTRLAGLKIHRPSHIYETREQALAVVRALRVGESRADEATAGQAQFDLRWRRERPKPDLASLGQSLLGAQDGGDGGPGDVVDIDAVV